LKAEAEIEHQKLLRQASIGLGMAGLLLFLMAFKKLQEQATRP